MSGRVLRTPAEARDWASVFFSGLWDQGGQKKLKVDEVFFHLFSMCFPCFGGSIYALTSEKQRVCAPEDGSLDVAGLFVWAPRHFAVST